MFVRRRPDVCESLQVSLGDLSAVYWFTTYQSISIRYQYMT
jgi:hypothetical protein